MKVATPSSVSCLRFTAVFESAGSNSFLIGFFHNGSISNSYFYDMLRIPFRFGTSIRLALRTANGPPVIVPPDNQPLAQGHYVFVDEGSRHTAFGLWLISDCLCLDNNVVEPEIGEEPSEARLVTPGSAEPRVGPPFQRLLSVYVSSLNLTNFQTHLRLVRLVGLCVLGTASA
jgi:hypothetical protein